jgi:hypothetical protein
MNNFKKRFNDEIINPTEISMIVKYNEFRNRSAGKIIFVEGVSDKHFYSNVTNSGVKLFCKAEYVFRSKFDRDKLSEDIVGKKAVFFAYKLIKDNKQLQKGMNKCIFIVDFDYEGIKSARHSFTSIDKNRISTTKYHSIESYFLTDNNTKRIFDYYNLSDKARLEFKSASQIFCNEVEEYFSLKGAIAACYFNNQKKPRYAKEYSHEEIFDIVFNSSNTFSYKQDYLKYEIKKMNRAISSNEFAMKRYDEIKKMISKNILFIQGHTSMLFLEKFLVDNFKIDFNSRASKNHPVALASTRLNWSAVTSVRSCPSAACPLFTRISI